MKLTYVYIAIIIYTLASYFHVGYVHADEYYQIFQFAANKLGLTNRGSWEFGTQMRSALLPGIIILIYKIYGIFVATPNPFVIGFIMRLFSSALSILSLCVFIKAFLPTISNSTHKRWFILLSLFTWANVYYNIHYCSENISGKFFILGFSILFLPTNKNILKYILSGILLGLAFTARFQIGFLMLGLVTWLIFVHKISVKNLFMLGCGFILTILVANIYLDHWFYGFWTISAWNYFTQNILMHQINNFGQESWLYYIYMTMAILPFGPFYVVASILLVMYKRLNVLTWLLFCFIAAHEFIGHKEIRFMVPIFSLMPLAVVYALQIVQDKFNYDVAYHWPKAIKAMWSINCFLFIVLLIPPTTEIPVWRYIYNAYNTPTTYYFLTYGGSDIDFYKNRNITSKHIDNIKDIHCDKQSKCLVGLTCMQALENGFPFANKIVFSQCPTWIYKINYTNWLGRTAIYNVYDISN